MKVNLFILLSVFTVRSVQSSLIFGTASASWQYEGFTRTDGRGPSIWDNFCTHPDPLGHKRCRDGAAVDAVQQYNLTKLAGDIERMKELGTTAYRLSIAWSRIMPTGRLPVEPRGVEHYKKVLRMIKVP